MNACVGVRRNVYFIENLSARADYPLYKVAVAPKGADGLIWTLEGARFVGYDIQVS